MMVKTELFLNKLDQQKQNYFNANIAKSKITCGEKKTEISLI